MEASSKILVFEILGEKDCLEVTKSLEDLFYFLFFFFLFLGSIAFFIIPFLSSCLVFILFALIFVRGNIVLRGAVFAAESFTWLCGFLMSEIWSGNYDG